MPVYLKLIVSALALALCTTVFLVDSGGGTARWVALLLGPVMVFSIWVFPEPKADAIRKEAAERRS